MYEKTLELQFSYRSLHLWDFFYVNFLNLCQIVANGDPAILSFLSPIIFYTRNFLKIVVFTSLV